MKTLLKRTPHLWAAIMAAILMIFCGCPAVEDNGDAVYTSDAIATDNYTGYDAVAPDSAMESTAGCTRVYPGGECLPEDDATTESDSTEDSTPETSTDEGTPPSCSSLSPLTKTWHYEENYDETVEFMPFVVYTSDPTYCYAKTQGFITSKVFAKNGEQPVCSWDTESACVQLQDDGRLKVWGTLYTKEFFLVE